MRRFRRADCSWTDKSISDFYRITNAHTKTYLSRLSPSNKAAGRTWHDLLSQYWHFTPVDSSKDFDQVHLDLMNAQKVLLRESVSKAQKERDQARTERDQLRKDLADAKKNGGEDDAKVKQALQDAEDARKKEKACAEARKAAEAQVQKAQKDRDNAEATLKHVSDQRDAAEDDIRRLRNKLDDAEYDLRRAKRDLEDAQSAESKAKRERDEAEDRAKKAKDAGPSPSAGNDLAAEKRRADNAEKALQELKTQLATAQVDAAVQQ